MSYSQREFGIRELCMALYKKIAIIIAVGISFAATSFIVSYYVLEPKYESTTQIYLLSKPDNPSEVTYSDLEISTQLIKDYMILITSRIVTEQVIKELKLDMNHADLVKLIHIENPNDSRVLNITAEYKDPLIAKRIADTAREVTSNLITSVTGQKQVSRIIEANLPDQPAAPDVKRNTLLGGAFGAVISAFIILLLYVSDDTVKRPEDIEKYLGINVLSTITVKKDN
jgi:capsular polysaccharide biosynthesis protein